MRGHISYKALIAGMTAVAISAGTVLAQSQQVPTGIQMTLDVLQRFSAGDNLSRTTSPTDSGVLSTTQLTFGLTSQTRAQDLSLRVGADARLGHLPDEGGRINELANPFYVLEYERRARGMELSFDASLRETALRDQVITVIDFDTLELSDLTIDNGNRTDTRADLRLISGRGGPVETDLRLRWNETTFDSSDASLLDKERLEFNATSRLALARNMDLILGLDLSEDKTFDVTTRTVDTLRYRVGVATDVTPATRLELVLGASTIDIEDAGTTSSDSAITARAVLNHDMPNGTIGVSYDRTHNTTGTKDALQFSRALELRGGALDFALGASRGENGNTSPVVSLSYQQELKRGVFIAALQQGTSANSAADEFSTLTANFRYLHQLTELAQLDLSLSQTRIEQIAGGTEERQRTTASVAVNYDLTADWALSTGLRHEAQSTDGVSTLEANELFATFNRSFDLRF